MGNITEQEFESQNQEITCEIGKCQKAIESYRKLSAMNIRYHDERPVDTLRRIYEAPELTREHMQFVKRIDICNTETFVIQLEEDTPLVVLCRNMDIYETD